MNYYDRTDTLLMATDFNGLIGKTRFPFYILLPQNQTEDILNKKSEELGIPVFRPYKLVDMHENPNDSRRLVDVSFDVREWPIYHRRIRRRCRWCPICRTCFYSP